jgi:hypothetical protein
LSSGNYVGCFVGMGKIANFLGNPIVGFAANYYSIYIIYKISLPIIFSFFMNDGKKTQIIIGFGYVTIQTHGYV